MFPFCFSLVELDFLSLAAKGILTDINQGDRVKRDNFRDPTCHLPSPTMALRIFHLRFPPAFPTLEDEDNSWEVYLHPVLLADGVPSKASHELMPQ